MSDELRLVDDAAAPEGVRTALREAAEAVEPYDVDAGLRRLGVALAAGGVAAAGGTAAASTAGSGLKVWGIVALTTVALGGGAAYVVLTSSAPAEPPARTPSDARPDRAAPADSRTSVTSEVAPPSVASNPSGPAEATPVAPADTDEDADEPVSAERVEAPRRPRAPSAPATTLRDETLHLARVRAALDESPAEALRLAREGQRRFRSGVFDEERSALIVMALDGLDRRAEAQRAARRFLARYPDGALSARVRRVAESR